MKVFILKKIAALLLAVLIMVTLSGCCPLVPVFKRFINADTDATSSTQQSDQMVEEIPEEPAPDTSATVSISRIDRSVTDSNGKVLVDFYYDQVFVSGTFEGVNKINAELVADMTEFFSNQGYIDELTSEAYLYDLFPFTCTRTAEISHNDGGVLCVEFVSEWYMGGVFNSDLYPAVFDLNTGETPKLEDLTGKDRAYLEKELKTKVSNFLVDYAGDSYAGTLATYSLEDFSYTIENGNIVIVFPSYEFTPECFTVDTNIAVVK